jgi:hypothetical protein
LSERFKAPLGEAKVARVGIHACQATVATAGSQQRLCVPTKPNGAIYDRSRSSAGGKQ